MIGGTSASLALWAWRRPVCQEFSGVRISGSSMAQARGLLCAWRLRVHCLKQLLQHQQHAMQRSLCNFLQCSLCKLQNPEYCSCNARSSACDGGLLWLPLGFTLPAPVPLQVLQSMPPPKRRLVIFKAGGYVYRCVWTRPAACTFPDASPLSTYMSVVEIDAGALPHMRTWGYPGGRH